MSISYQFLETSNRKHSSASLHQQKKDLAENEYDRINRLLSNMASGMNSSMEEIQKINNMMKMISFNSKIEAAKAGEAGKSFSVVSGEMKTLSEQTGVVAGNLRKDTEKTISELLEASNAIATHVRGTRLSDLALTNIDLIDRNLYERSCDVRWWATDSSLVDALSDHSDAACKHASDRLGIILNAYTVYFDLVLCDTNGEIVANGRPRQFHSKGRNQSTQDWFKQAMNSHSGEDYGFQTVHESDLVNKERVLVYSSAVREQGKSSGSILGVLGILFNYDSLAQAIMLHTPIEADLKHVTRVCITDDKGLVLADSFHKILQEKIEVPDMDKLYVQEKGFLIKEIRGEKYCIAHAMAPGYETYSTNWHSLILQKL